MLAFILNLPLWGIFAVQLHAWYNPNPKRPPCSWLGQPFSRGDTATDRRHP
jgi:hypothetical protein